MGISPSKEKKPSEVGRRQKKWPEKRQRGTRCGAIGNTREGKCRPRILNVGNNIEERLTLLPDTKGNSGGRTTKDAVVATSCAKRRV